jgi:hypothetical protein
MFAFRFRFRVSSSACQIFYSPDPTSVSSTPTIEFDDSWKLNLNNPKRQLTKLSTMSTGIILCDDLLEMVGLETIEIRAKAQMEKVLEFLDAQPMRQQDDHYLYQHPVGVRLLQRDLRLYRLIWGGDIEVDLMLADVEQTTELTCGYKLEAGTLYQHELYEEERGIGWHLGSISPIG